MAKAIIDISDYSNRILNIVKAKHGLKNKSDAIDMMAKQYEEEILEPRLKPEYIEKTKKRMKEKSVPVGSPEDLKEVMGL